MQNLLVTIRLTARSGIVADEVVNTFAVKDPGEVFDPDVTFPLVNSFQQLYNHVTAPRLPLGAYIGDMINHETQHVVSIYDLDGHLDGSNHGSPVAQDIITLPASSVSNPYPREVAAVVTLRGQGWQTASVSVPLPPTGPAGDLRPKQQLSGRTYLGPLGSVGSTIDPTTLELYLHPTFRLVALDAFESLFDNLATAGFVLGVWSRKLEVITPVTHVQIDNAFDTMRKRGNEATVRDTRAV